MKFLCPSFLYQMFLLLAPNGLALYKFEFRVQFLVLRVSIAIWAITIHIFNKNVQKIKKKFDVNV